MQDVDIKAQIRTVPDFPKPGVLFRDITTLLKQADALAHSEYGEYLRKLADQD